MTFGLLLRPESNKGDMRHVFIQRRLRSFSTRCSFRSVQLEILPDHGYEGSEVGVEQILGFESV